MFSIGVYTASPLQPVLFDYRLARRSVDGGEFSDYS